MINEAVIYEDSLLKKNPNEKNTNQIYFLEKFDGQKLKLLILIFYFIFQSSDEWNDFTGRGFSNKTLM